LILLRYAAGYQAVSEDWQARGMSGRTAAPGGGTNRLADHVRFQLDFRDYLTPQARSLRR
jgi:hypothetical protein